VKRPQDRWIVENDSYIRSRPPRWLKEAWSTRDDVFALVSTLGTVTAVAVLPFLAQRGVPIVNPAGGHMLLNKRPIRRVRHLADELEIGESDGGLRRTELGAKRIAIFFQNDQFGKDQRDGAVAALRSSHGAGRGGELRAERCRRQRAGGGIKQPSEVIILGVIPKHGALFVKEAQRLGWKPKMVGHNTVADPVRTRSCGR